MKVAAEEATRANLWLLAVVSAWRVMLMTRVICVVYEARAWRAFFLVMFFADTVALVLLFLTPLPVLSLMGGIRLTESEQLIQGTAFLIGVLGVLSWPIWFFGAAVAIAISRLSAITLLSLINAYSYEQLVEESLQYLPLFMFPEAFVTGMLVTIFVVYRPGWIATFDDERYIRGK